jgi:hypothetical protein
MSGFLNEISCALWFHHRSDWLSEMKIGERTRLWKVPSV